MRTRLNSDHSQNPSVADLALMDTNQDGVVNNADDAYSPYYPGDAFVDWVGSSIYTYGTSHPVCFNLFVVVGQYHCSSRKI